MLYLITYTSKESQNLISLLIIIGHCYLIHLPNYEMKWTVSATAWRYSWSGKVPCFLTTATSLSSLWICSFFLFTRMFHSISPSASWSVWWLSFMNSSKYRRKHFEVVTFNYHFENPVLRLQAVVSSSKVMGLKMWNSRKSEQRGGCHSERMTCQTHAGSLPFLPMLSILLCNNQRHLSLG